MNDQQQPQPPNPLQRVLDRVREQRNGAADAAATNAANVDVLSIALDAANVELRAAHAAAQEKDVLIEVLRAQVATLQALVPAPEGDPTATPDAAPVLNGAEAPLTH